jgi:outer membrane protein assembly complex protein YaeT
MAPGIRVGTLPRTLALALALTPGLLLFSPSPPSARAQIPLELRGRRVVEVRIEGETEGITEPREIGIPLGTPLTRRSLRSAVSRLAASGRWRDAQIDIVPSGAGVALVVHLVPRVLLTRVELQGNDVLDDPTLARVIEVSEGSELEADTRISLVRSAREAYRERGYERVRIETIVRDTDDPTKKVLIVRIAEGEPTRVVRVQFEGEAPPPASGASDALGISVGDILDERNLEESVRDAESAMRARGFFEATLGPVVTERRRGGVVVSIPARPGPRYDVVFRGYAPLHRQDLEAVLNLGTEPLSSVVIDGIEERVVDLYLRHGFLDATAEVKRVRGERPGTAHLVIEASPGPAVRVTSLSFPGSRHFDRELLTDQVVSYLEEDLPRSGVFDPVDTAIIDDLGFGGATDRPRESPPPLVVNASEVYYAPTYDEAVEHIRELYSADGYLDAEVGPARMIRVDERHARVEVPIVEGPRTMLHRVTLEGNEAVSARDILVAAGLERDAPFSHLALEEARIRVVDLYQDRGYLYARVEPTVRFSEDKTRAEVHVQVVEAYPVRVGSVVVRGAQQTDEALVRDRMRLGPGDLYRPALVRESQEQLLELGVFAGVNITPEDADLPAQVKNVVVTVTERQTQYLDLTAGLSTGQGLRGGFEYGYRNLLGYGITANVRVQLGFQFFFVDTTIESRYEKLRVQDRLERNVALGLGVPHVPGVPNVRLGLNLFHRRDNERDFGFDQNGVSLSGTWRPIRRLTVSTAASVENSNVQLFTGDNLAAYLMMNPDDPRLQRLLRVPEGESTIIAFPATVALDMRDNPFDPTEGFFASVTGEYAATLSSEPEGPDEEPFSSNFLKVTLAGSGYVPLFDELVFAAQVRFGRVIHLEDGSKTYPNRSYYLGGIETMRGYFQDAMIPQDLADEIESNPAIGPNDVVRAGDTFLIVRGELRFPIIGDLRGGVFADVGNLWADPTRIDPLALRPSAGVGLRLKTPVGPLAFDYGIILLRREQLNEPFGTFHFSIGLF